MALAATSAFAEGTVDPNHPDSRFQTPQSMNYSSSASSDIRNADSALWGVGA